MRLKVVLPLVWLLLGVGLFLAGPRVGSPQEATTPETKTPHGRKLVIKNRDTQEVKIQKNPFGGKGEIYRWFYFSQEDAPLVKTANEASMTPGSYSALHGWENAYEMMYFLEGEGTYQKDGEEPVPIKAGDVVLHKPGERFSIHNTLEKPLRYLVVLVTSDEEVRPLK